MKKYIKRTYKLFISLAGFVLAVIIVDFLQRNTKIFGDYADGLTYYQMIFSFFRDMYLNWLALLTTLTFIVIVFVKTGDIETVIDKLIVAETTKRDIILSWLFVMISIIVGLFYPLAAMFSSLLIPFLTMITIYYYLKKSEENENT